MSFDAGGDLCLGFWQEAWEAKVIQLAPEARVLEIGCGEANWLTPMHVERPDLTLIGVDWRKTVRPGAETMQGDVRAVALPSESFDLIVAVSAIEHIGLGAYHDPVDADGDVTCAQRVVAWLKPGGWWYFDVPARETFTVFHKHRAYDDAAIRARLLPVPLVERWRKIHRSTHPDGPYVSVIAQKV